MGCLCSRGLHEENSPRLFNVINVDDLGQERNPGNIEITESELVWYQRGKEPIRWPLHSLRRYGFDAELFSFESGRRCPTGPGIYAFKCRRAEALFNLLQDSIQRQRSGQDDGSLPPTSVLVPTSQHTQTVARTNSHVTEGAITRVSRSNSVELDATSALPISPSPPLYINGVVHTQRHEYMNTELNPSVSEVRHNSIADTSGISAIVPPASVSTADPIQYAELDLPKPDEGPTMEASVPHIPNGHGPHRVDSVQVSASSQQVMYVNVPANEIKKLASLGGSGSGNGKAPPAPPPSVGNGLAQQYCSQESGRAPAVALPALGNGSKVNYIQIDHGDHPSENTATGLNQSPLLSANILSTPESPTRTKTDTYACIDIERTQALHKNRRRSTDDEGSRKTRHNSNIEELYGGET